MFGRDTERIGVRFRVDGERYRLYQSLGIILSGSLISEINTELGAGEIAKQLLSFGNFEIEGVNAVINQIKFTNNFDFKEAIIKFRTSGTSHIQYCFKLAYDFEIEDKYRRLIRRRHYMISEYEYSYYLPKQNEFILIGIVVDQISTGEKMDMNVGGNQESYITVPIYQYNLKLLFGKYYEEA